MTRPASSIGSKHDRGRMPHDGDLVLAAVGEPTALDLDREHAALEDDRISRDIRVSYLCVETAPASSLRLR